MRKRRLEGLVSTSFTIHDADAKVKKQHQPNGIMMGVLRGAALSRHHEEWQIIEVRDSTASSGELVVWFLINGNSLQRVQLTVPRILYISCRRELPVASVSKGMIVKKADRQLPHGKQATHLYEITMPEWYFRKCQWKEQLLN